MWVYKFLCFFFNPIWEERSFCLPSFFDSTMGSIVQESFLRFLNTWKIRTFGPYWHLRKGQRSELVVQRLCACLSFILQNEFSVRFEIQTLHDVSWLQPWELFCLNHTHKCFYISEISKNNTYRYCIRYFDFLFYYSEMRGCWLWPTELIS